MSTNLDHSPTDQDLSWIPVTDLLIDGHRVPGEGIKLPVPSPVTGRVLATVPTATREQTEQAIGAARQAFDDGRWTDLTGEERRSYLHRFADIYDRSRDQLIDAIVDEVGTPVSQARSLQVDFPLEILRWNAEAAAKDRTEQLGARIFPPASVSSVHYRPVGVVAAITAYNYPLDMAIWKVAPALAAGCTVVLMPSPRAPLTTLLLADMVLEAGFPPGVVNILVGDTDVGRELTTHPYIDKISFTGSTHVGREIMRQASSTIKGLVLELGGKSANIILPGTELEPIIEAIHLRYARNAGQGCASPTRILVHESQKNEFIKLTRAVFSNMKVGDPRDPKTVVGPLIRPEHRDRVRGFVDRAIDAGGTLIAGGDSFELGGGAYLGPTVVGDLPLDAEIVQEEVFGPVAVLSTYADLDDAVALANGTIYGLSSYIYGDRDQALAVAPRLRAGGVMINGGGPMPVDAPFGGFKQSGLGREMGEYGIREFLEPQHIQIAIS